jgi:hypothetical protein
MAGFRKAKAEQAALKLGLYGPAGSGKTMTALLLAEGLSATYGKRVAYIDTERGTDFYCQAVKSRAVHPEAFDFDALYSRSITEILDGVKALDVARYSVVVIDSITHVWQACIEAYSGRTTSIGSIPMQAWGKIKKPYKELMGVILSSPMHVIICGRQATDYGTDEESGELKALGVKMRAEGETAYEPHILIRMSTERPTKTNEIGTVVAYAEKDRTGVLSGRSFVNPTFDSLCRPLLGLLGETQARIASGDEAAMQDAEALSAQEAERERASTEQLRVLSARISLAEDVKALKGIGKEITPALKARMVPSDLAKLREAYQDREGQLAGNPSPAASVAALKDGGME